MNETVTVEKIKNKIEKMQKGGNISKAIEMCRSALQNDPTNADLHIRLGDLYLEKHLDISWETAHRAASPNQPI